MSRLATSSKHLYSHVADLYRRATSPFRRLPDFIIIGAQKAGTSSLYFYLSQHPEISMSALKETHYYNYHIVRGKGLNWYRSFFPLKLKTKNRITGEASPYYLFDRDVPVRIKRDLPTVKLIALFRDPIDRAYSAYNMNKRQCRTKNFPTFEEAIANPDTSFEQSRLYLYRGQYSEHIKPWFAAFPRDQILCIRSEDLFREPRKSLDEVYEFLGVEKIYPENTQAQEVGSYPGLSAKTRLELEQFFKPTNDELAKLLGDRYRW